MTYLSYHTHANTEVSSPHIIELLEPFGESSWSETEWLLPITPSIKVDETALSSSISHESDVACLEECDAKRKHGRHDPELIIAAGECVRRR